MATLAHEAGAPPAAPEAEVVVLPTSFAQERMWFLERLSEGSGAYNTPIAVRLDGRLDRRALTHALAGVVRRHEVLRTRFPTIDGEPVQVVSPTARVAWPLVDLSALPEDARRAELDRLVARAAAHRFSLARGPLLRTLLVRLAPESHVALCTLHHIVSDGWSLGLMVRELAAGYAAALRGERPQLPPLVIQYGDFAEWQRGWMKGEAFRRQLAYWTAKLAGAPADPGLPTDRPRTAATSFRGSSVPFRVGGELHAAVLKVARERGATPMMVMLAAFEVLLARYGGQADVVVGSPIANRDRPELEPLIGFFANTVALRTDLSGDPTFAQALARVRATSVEAHANQDVPFQKVVEALRPDAPAGANPLFQVGFNHRAASGSTVAEVALPGLTLRPLNAGYESAKFDLQLYLDESAAGVEGSLFYRTDLFDAETAEGMARHYAHLLHAAVNSPDTPISQLPLMDAAERAHVLHGLGSAPSLASDDRLLDIVRHALPHAAGAGVRAYVLDARQEPVPAGVRGELFVGGPEIPSIERSAVDLHADPFAGEGARMLRTGVRARWRADGTLVIDAPASDGRVDGDGSDAGSPAGARPNVGAAFVAPRDEVERAVAAIWKDVLGVERVGVFDGFFELGGYSLLTVRIATRIRAALGVEVPVAAFFSHPTVAALAEWIAGQGRSTAPAAVIEPADRSRPLPLSTEQERLWFMSHVGDTEYSYTVSKGIRLEGVEIDAELLAACFGHVVERHEALRTVFREEGGEARQVVLPPAPFDLPVVDLSHLADAERGAELARLALAESARPFDLAAGPLFRALLVRTGPRESVLLTNAHHIVTDAWSTGILVSELVECYQAVAQLREPSLPALPVQYPDYAAWQRRWLESPEARAQADYWRGRLAGLPQMDLRPDRPRPERVSYRGERLRMRLDPALSARVRATAEGAQATLFMVLLSAFQVVLAHHARQRDVVVGIDVANRRTPEVERLIGFFINEVVLRTDLSGDPTFAELLARVRRVTLEAYQNQDLPFASVVKETGGRRDAASNPLFQVMFGLKNAPMPQVDMEGLSVRPVEVASEVSVFELCLYMEDTPQGIVGLFTWRSDLYDAALAEAMRDGMAAVLAAAVEQPEVRVEALIERLAAAERARRAERARAAEQAGRALFRNVRRRDVAVPHTDPQEPK